MGVGETRDLGQDEDSSGDGIGTPLMLKTLMPVVRAERNTEREAHYCP